MLTRYMPHRRLFGGSTLFLATLFFTFQLYCDFSGYSDIAIGSANILGIRLTQNFNLPYLASSIGEFWKRWHMSLTAWFRDYVFLPLSFALSWRIKSERVMLIKTDMFIYIVASLVTWLLTGLWHGAGYTFIVWGLLQCLFLVVYRWQTKPARKLYKKLGISQKNRLITLAGTLADICCRACLMGLFQGGEHERRGLYTRTYVHRLEQDAISGSVCL